MIRLAFGGEMGAGKTATAEAIKAILELEGDAPAIIPLARELKGLASIFKGAPIEKGRDRALLQRFNCANDLDHAWVADALKSSPATKAHAAYVLASMLDEGSALDLPVDPEARSYQWIKAINRLERALFDGPMPFALGWGREDYWIKRHARLALAHEGPVLVDDVRRPLEAESLKRAGFVLVRIDTPPEVRKRRILARDGAWDEAWLNHESERQIGEIDFDLAIQGIGDVQDNALAILRALASIARA